MVSWLVVTMVLMSLFQSLHCRGWQDQEPKQWSGRDYHDVLDDAAPYFSRYSLYDRRDGKDFDGNYLRPSRKLGPALITSAEKGEKRDHSGDLLRMLTAYRLNRLPPRFG
ncbi:hypothetical protein BV898_07377 [Hypsibius exemplaris]|uniref:Uncharacterized protein n=1 Tax=Hypsibius exemplaris TaxID=2072580 RepID=A0A1W0WTN1_HYPEX|nr:hypothetical protein BV898_07377 [Hypsibius exemplaris]